jgi:HlyD family secretion protein
MKQRHVLIWVGFLFLFFIQCQKGNQKKLFTAIVEGKVYTLSTAYSDKIILFLKEEGDRVRKGELIAKMDTFTVSLQLQQNRSRISELQLQISNARMQLKQVQDQLNYVKDLYQKNVELALRNAISSQKLEDIKLKYTNTQSQFRMAQTNVKILEKKLEQANLNSKLLNKKLKDAHLRSPENGVIDRIYYETGETPPPFSPIADIVDLRDMWCYIYVNETDLGTLKIGQEVTVRMDGNSSSFKGKIIHINQQAEFTPKNILTPDNRKALVFGVKVKIDNSSGVFKPGMPVEVEL